MGIGSLSKFDALFGAGMEQYLPMLPAKAVKDKLPEEVTSSPPLRKGSCKQHEDKICNWSICILNFGFGLERFWV